MDIEVKTEIDKLGRAWEAFKAANDAHLAEVKKGLDDVVRRDQLDKLNLAIDALQESKDALDARMTATEKLAARPKADGSPDAEAREVKSFNAQRELRGQKIEVDVEGLRGYKGAFGNYLRKGDEQMWNDGERKSLSVGSDPDGGYLIPPATVGRVIARLFDTSPMRQLATVDTIGTEALEGLRDTDEAAAGWVGETDARPDTTTPKVGMYKIVAHEMYAQPDATQKMLDDANVDVEAWLAAKVADRFTRLENTAFVAGNGVARPRGFTTYATAATADGARAWGTLEHINTGNNGAFASSNPADVLFDLIAAFKPGYLAGEGVSWVTRRTVVAAIRKLKEATTNAYMWQPGLQQGQPQRLLDFPVTLFEDMPALATGSLSLALGNFRLGYQIVDRAGIRVLRDPYTNKPFVRFYTTKRTGGDVVQFEAIKFIRFGT